MMTHREQVAELVVGLRGLADFYDAHPDMPMPCLDIVNAYAESKAALADAAREMAPCKKTFNGDWFSLTKAFSSVLRLDVNIKRGQVCERRIVGTKRIPAKVTPAHDEPIIDRHCADSVVLEEA